MRGSSNNKKIPLLITAIILVSGIFFRPVTAQAQVIIPASFTTVIEDIVARQQSLVNRVKEKITKALKVSSDISFKNTIRIFELQLLNQARVALATRGPGQQPLFITDRKHFLKNVANRAAGDVIDQYTRGISGGRLVGEPLSGARGRFIISQLLGSYALDSVNSQVNQCINICAKQEVTLDESAILKMSEKEFTSYYNNPESFDNIHEKNIAYVRYKQKGPKGTAEAVAANNDIACAGVVLSQSNSAARTWVINTDTTWSSGTISAADCFAHQEEAYNNEQSTAGTEGQQCRNTCTTRGAAANQAINGFTATDVFSAFDKSSSGVRNADPRKAPAALANALSGDKSDLGQFLSAAGALTATIQSEVTGEDDNLKPGILPITTRVSEQITTPSEGVRSLFGLPSATGGQNVYTGSSVADTLKGIASFIKSPIGQWIKDTLLSQCGLNPAACKGASNAQSAIGRLLYGNGNPTGVTGAQLIFASSGQTQIISGDPGRSQIDVTEQLSGGGLIDSGFRQAIDSQLTVQEAIDQHMIDPNRTFGFDKNGLEPADGYTYRALQYLRKFRVIPVGWELAAKYTQQFDHRDLSLGYLISRYPICGADLVVKKCSVSNVLCTSDAQCTAPGDSCVTQTVHGTHSVCSRGPKADQSCQADSDCGDDENGAPITCGASPYCGLVDPNWVLKAPQTFCRRQGAGEEIITKEFVCDQNNIDAASGSVIAPGVTCKETSVDGSCTDTGAPNCVASITNLHPDIGRWVIERNSDTCADTQSCIAENEDGSCRAYGYCVQEKQQFKFNGTQCSSQYSSCSTYTNTAGQQVSYLSNTLDSRTCTADNAGCTQYCSAKLATGGTNYDPSTSTCTDPNQTINFTGKVQSCDPSQVGCQQYIRVVPGTNLLANGNFETFDQAIDGNLAANFSGWTKNGLRMLPVTATDTANTGNNAAAAQLDGTSGNDSITQTVHTGYELYERTFSLSLRARAATACSVRLGLEVSGTDPNRPRVPTDTNPNIDITTEWKTYDVTLSVPQSGTVNLDGNFDLQVSLALGTCAPASTQFTIDSAQLEEGTAPSQYVDYGTTNLVHLNAQRQSCTAADVGCLAYTPSTGGDTIYGQVRNSNRCSADQVGCNTYQLQPTTNVPIRSGGPVNIIAPKGQICSAAEVGCEEYTNLDEVAKGGEGKEYYTTVKQCVRPKVNDPSQGTYYTWVGDAQLGYVLRAYDLVKTNDSATSGAPCTSLSVGSISSDPVCQDTAATITAATCSINDLLSNPDCAQFYDSALTVYYRLRSKTVSVTNDCHPYRNTVDQDASSTQDRVYYLSTGENVSCSAAAKGCRAYTGNTSGAKRQVFSDAFETNTTVQWVGGTISNASTSVNGHSLQISVNGPSSAAATVDSILRNQIFGGRTYLVSFTTAAAPVANNTSAVPPPSSVTVSFGSVSGNVYTPSTNAVFPGTAAAAWNTAITPAGPEWHSYTLGPLTIPSDIANAQLGFQLTPGSGSVYIDNVQLTEVNDKLYLVSQSVPQCSAADVGCSAYKDNKGRADYLTSFSRLCSQQVLNCEAMIDTRNSSSPFATNVKGVTVPEDAITQMVNNPAVYCPASAKGCSAVGQPTYGPDQKLIGYQTKYLINNPDRYSGDICLNTELSCQAYTVANGGQVYFKDPGNRVCEYRSADDASSGWYIVGTQTPCPTVTPPLSGRPVGASCSPVCTGGSRAGQACLTNNDCSGGSCTGDPSTIGIIQNSGVPTIGQCTSNSDCLGGNSCMYLAGICPNEQNGCTEYRDPSDPQSCRAECPLSMSKGGSPDYVDGACQITRCADGDRTGQNCRTDADCFDGSNHSCVGSTGQPAIGMPGCQSYFYLRQSIAPNANDCNGKVDIARGCLPFNDTTNPNLNFRGQ